MVKLLMCDTFSGVDFNKGLFAVNKLSEIVPKNLLIPASSKVDLDARCYTLVLIQK